MLELRTQSFVLIDRVGRDRARHPDNIRLLCRLHNPLEARIQLGDEVMDRFSATRVRDATAPPRAFRFPTAEDEQVARSLER